MRGWQMQTARHKVEFGRHVHFYIFFKMRESVVGYLWLLSFLSLEESVRFLGFSFACTFYIGHIRLYSEF